MLAGKFAGICTKLFGTNCWATQTKFVAKGEAYDEFVVAPSDRDLEAEIRSLLESDAATRADMAVAMQCLQDTEKTLRDATLKYDRLVRSIPDGVYSFRFTVGKTLAFDYVSPRFCEIINQPAEEILRDAHVAFNVLHPEDRERYFTESQRSRVALAPFRWEGRALVNGKVKWIRLASDPTPVGNGESHWHGVLSDVTEKRMAEESLQNLATELQATLQAVPDLLFELDDNGKFLKIWAHDKKLLFAPEERILGRAFAEILPPEAARTVEAAIKEASTEGYSRGQVIKLELPNGTKWFELSTAMKPATKYQSPQFIVLSRDLTDRMDAYAALAQEKERFETLMHTSGDGIYILEQDGVVVEVNDRFCEMLGYSREEIMGMKVGDWDAKLSGPELKNLIDENFAKPSIFETTHRRKDGSLINVEISSKAMRLGGRLVLWNASRDMTQRKKMEDELRLSASIYQNSNEGMLVADGDNIIVAVNPAFTRLTGYSAEDVIGKSPSLLQSGLQSREFYREMWDRLESDGRWEGEIWNRHKLGHYFAEQLSITVVKNKDGSVHRFIAQFSDVTEKKKKEDQIWQHANYDNLTGLPNRRLFLDRLEMEIKKAKRGNYGLALLFIDLDRFKEVNDTMGHAKGDILLREAADRIRKCLRDSDTVARLGGDEFTTIIADYGDQSRIEQIAQRILNLLGQPFDLGGDDCAFVSASIGIATFPTDADDVETLMKHADQSMYAAKSQGRNQFGFFTPSMQKAAQEKLDLSLDLRIAVVNCEFELHYQPIVNLKDGGIAKAEALLRWRHPRRGMVSPAVFIPIAEESGLIHEIGEWVFEQAVTDVAGWLAKFGGPIEVAVNKSPTQFMRASGSQWLEKLAQKGLPPGSITVEITEGTLLKESASVKQCLAAFKENGVLVALDDFGTGYSALSYLQLYEVEYVKIDRSFISGMITSEKNQALVEAMIAMAHKLGIRTIAEGVETQAHHDILVKLGCDFAQGFLYSKAVPKQEFERFIDPKALKKAG